MTQALYAHMNNKRKKIIFYKCTENEKKKNGSPAILFCSASHQDLLQIFVKQYLHTSMLSPGSF
jgi:hypothetical protein